MTTRVTVKNENPGGDGLKSVIIESSDGGETAAQVLAPGESAEIWLHGAKSITVKESAE